MKRAMHSTAFILIAAIIILPSYGRPGGGALLPVTAIAKNEISSRSQQYDAYADRWNVVKEFEDSGKPRSAMEEVEKILLAAKKDRNAPQIVKAHIHRIKYIMEIGEKEHPDVLRMLEKEIAAAGFPEKQILMSLLAEAYWNYFAANRWAFYNRTATVNLKEEDISTWSLTKIMGRIIELHTASLDEADRLKKTGLGLMDEIVVRGNVPRSCRPTLYDFLAHRALDFFMIDENQLTRPAYDFEVDSADYSAPAETFVRMKVTARDKTSLRYNAVMIFQDLTRFHLDDADPGALIDVELKRLQFIREKSVLPDKESLYFSSLERLEKRSAGHTASGLVLYEIARWYQAKGNEWKEGDPGDHRWSIKKSAEIARGVIRRFPGSEGALLCAPLTLVDKNISLTSEKVNVPGRQFRALVKYKNISTLHLRMARLTREQYEYMNNSYDPVEKKVDALLKIKPLHEWRITLPDDGDLREHAAETKIPAVKSGWYAVLAGTDRLFSYKNNAVAFLTATASNLSFTHRVSRREGAVFQVFHRDSGVPLKDVQAVITERTYDYTRSAYVTRAVGKLVSDIHGRIVFPMKQEGRYHGTMSISLRKNADRLDSEFYSYAQGEGMRNARQTYFFTDRSIYRPGQTVYFKAILLRLAPNKRYAIMSDEETVIEFLDYNNQNVGQSRLRSNRFGSVSGSFTAPAGTLAGQMTIRNNSGSTVIRVEEYKRPRFEAGFEPVKGNYRLGEKISAKGFARSYSGAPLSEAAVKYSVVRRIWFPFRWWGWYYRHYNGQEVVIKKGESATNAKGEFTIEFAALPDKRIPKSEQPSFYYEVHADVTDINGETHSTAATVRAGYVSLAVDINGLQASVDAGKPLQLQIRTANLSGEPVPAKGSISIVRVNEPERLLRPRFWERPDRFIISKEEYIRVFPNDIYRDEDDIAARGTGKRYFEARFDTADKKIIRPGDLHSWPEGDYLIELKTEDAYGEAVTYQKYFSVYSPNAGRFNRENYFTIIPIVETAEPGSNAVLLIGSAAAAHVVLDIVRQGSLERKVVKLDGDKKIISVPVREEDRGNIQYRYALVKNNRLYTGEGAISVPWTNKQLKAEFMTFRSMLRPGEKESWRIKITGLSGDAAAAEIAASMYDASLDSLYPHGWQFGVNYYFYNYEYWQTNSTFTVEQSRIAADNWNRYPSTYSRSYDHLNLFGVYFYSRGRGYRYYKSASRRSGAEPAAADEVEDKKAEREEAAPPAPKKKNGSPPEQTKGAVSVEENKSAGESAVQIRKNLNETAFFFPHLVTNEKGEVIVSFTAPEALTRWKVLGFAHTRDLKSTMFMSELITQKDLMVTPNVPRFLREGDTLFISSKISNMTDRKLAGKASLELFDAVTMKPIDRELSNIGGMADFSVAEKGNAAVSWKIRIPASAEAVTWRIVARAGNFSDGEEATLPVLSNRMLVTESLPLPVRGNQKKDFTFEKLLKSGFSETLAHHRLTLEFTSNPAWYAVQALPYLMEFPHECSEQVFSRFYANSLAAHIVNSSPKIKAVFDRWSGTGALLSNLQKNEELKSVMLEETPWLLDGRNEEQNKKRVALFFDLNRMSHELDRALAKLTQMQGHNGGWPWFAGLPESWYITQHILAGLAKLGALGAREAARDRLSGMTEKAVRFIDNEMKRDYDQLLQYKVDLKQKNIGYIHYHYLYARSFFKDIAVPEQYRKAFDYWKEQAAAYWVKDGPFIKGLAAIALFRFNDKKTAGAIIESLRETSIYSEELGMYWKENVGGYWWFQAPIETQALLIEAFSEAARDGKSVDDMRTWLLKAKQVQHWSTTKSTTEACYALLMGRSDWLKNEQLTEVVVGGTRVDPAAMGAKTEAGTGYYKVSWDKGDIRPDTGRITVVNNNSNPAWGALYWQYFEQMDKITPHETPLKLEKKFFLVSYTDKGPVLEQLSGSSKLKPGDKLKVRIILRVDRDMDYVHMKDLRAAGTEPENVLSRHRYQDGLWYYESTRDAATHFFIERLPKGTYVFEYPLVVNLKGDFSAGITTIQCMYAPEFTSHSEGSRLRVD